MDDFEEPLNRSIFALRPFQPKNPREKNENFGALRAPTREGERKKQEEKFFDSRIVGPKAAEQCFFSKLLLKQGARSARKIFRLFHASEASMLQKSARKFPT